MRDYVPIPNIKDYYEYNPRTCMLHLLPELVIPSFSLGMFCTSVA